MELKHQIAAYSKQTLTDLLIWDSLWDSCGAIQPGAGWRGGGGVGRSQDNVCRVSAHPGWQQHEHLSQETSLLLSHSNAGQSIWGSAVWALLIVIYLWRSYYSESGNERKIKGIKVPNETRRVDLPDRNSSDLHSHASFVSVWGWEAGSPNAYVTGIIRISYGAGGSGVGGCREFRGLDEMRANDTLDVVVWEGIQGKRSRVLRWPCLIFHHTPKLGMLMVITYLSNCFSWEGGCHIHFPGGQESQAVERKRVDQSLLISPKTPRQTVLFKGHLLQKDS